MRGLSKLESGLMIGGFIVEVVRTIIEARKEHQLEGRVDRLEEQVQSLGKVAHRHTTPRSRK